MCHGNRSDTPPYRDKCLGHRGSQHFVLGEHQAQELVLVCAITALPGEASTEVH
jgi:hypothetical protein